jgi:hypothetical protein
MNEMTFITYGNKQYMKGNKIAKASYGWFFVEKNRVEYFVAGVSQSESEDCFSDDLMELKDGNVDFNHS